MDGWKINFLVERPILRCYISFREVFLQVKLNSENLTHGNPALERFVECERSVIDSLLPGPSWRILENPNMSTSWVNIFLPMCKTSLGGCFIGKVDGRVFCTS